MSTKSKTLAKSLHTITILVRVAELIRAQSVTGATNGACMTRAMALLGYEGAADPYDLFGKALAQMNAADDRAASKLDLVA